MGLRDRILEKIKRKEQEITELELKIREGKAYIQALSEAIRLVPIDQAGTQSTTDKALKPGSVVAKASALILQKGKPLHIVEILKGLDMPVSKQNKTSLAGSLAAYAKKRNTFEKTAPNTFGLIGMSTQSALPVNFGIPTIDEDIPF